jgi:hypothetical protein
LHAAPLVTAQLSSAMLLAVADALLVACDGKPTCGLLAIARRRNCDPPCRAEAQSKRAGTNA